MEEPYEPTHSATIQRAYVQRTPVSKGSFSERSSDFISPVKRSINLDLGQSRAATWSSDHVFVKHYKLDTLPADATSISTVVFQSGFRG